MSLSITSFTAAGASTVTATFTKGLSVHSFTSSNLSKHAMKVLGTWCHDNADKIIMGKKWLKNSTQIRPLDRNFEVKLEHIDSSHSSCSDFE